MSSYERHRFVSPAGGAGGQCEVPINPEGLLCRLNYSASAHYNDDDHPFDAGEPAGASCGWQMQNTPGVGANIFCWRMADDPVHHHDDLTMAFEVPVAEPPFPDGRVYGTAADAPGEDDQFQHTFTDGVHNLFHCGHPQCRKDAAAAEAERPYQHAGAPWAAEEAWSPLPPLTPPQALGSPAWAAWNLAHGQVLGSGPWPVRQWYCPDGGAPEAWEEPGELICALNVAGEPFTVDVWWAAPEVRLVRVTWSGLLGLDDGALCAAVESWIVP